MVMWQFLLIQFTILPIQLILFWGMYSDRVRREQMLRRAIQMLAVRR